MITSMHHLAIISGSEKSPIFYKSLGFTEVFRKKREYDTVIIMDGYGIRLEFFVDPRHPSRPEFEPLGLRHFALQISGKLEDEMERLSGLLSGQIEFSPIYEDWFGVRYCFFKDPDGLKVELREES